MITPVLRGSFCLAIALSLGLSLPVAADEWNDALGHAIEYARMRLDQVNAQDGVEHVGGPFHFGDYRMTHERRRFSDGTQALHVEFEYSRPHGLDGVPDSFDFYVYLDPELPADDDEPVPYVYTPHDVVGDFADDELEDVLRLFRLHARADGLLLPTDFVTIEADGTVRRDEITKYGLSRVERTGPDEVQVEYGYTFTQEPIGPSVSMNHVGGQWQPDYIHNDADLDVPALLTEIGEGIRMAPEPLVPLPQQFEILGSIGDEELLSLIQTVRHIEGMAQQIVSVSIPDDDPDARDRDDVFHEIELDDAYVDSGVMSRVEPSGLLTLRLRETGWQLVRYLDVMNFDTHIPGLSLGLVGTLPLPPKPNPAEVLAALDEVRIKGDLPPDDQFAIAEFIIRLRFTWYPLRWMTVVGPGRVDVRTGVPAGRSGESIDLEKINGVWIIVAIGSWDG